MLWNAACSLARSTVADAACSLIAADCWWSISRRRLDQVAGRRVEGRDLVEDELLVGQRLGHDDRRPQRGDGRGRGAVDALDQLDVVAPDQVEREVALDAHRELGEQVLDLLADGEEHVLLEDLGPVRIGRLDLGDLLRRGRVSSCWAR